MANYMQVSLEFSNKLELGEIYTIILEEEKFKIRILGKELIGKLVDVEYEFDESTNPLV